MDTALIVQIFSDRQYNSVSRKLRVGKLHIQRWSNLTYFTRTNVLTRKTATGKMMCFNADLSISVSSLVHIDCARVKRVSTVCVFVCVCAHVCEQDYELGTPSIASAQLLHSSFCTFWEDDAVNKWMWERTMFIHQIVMGYFTSLKNANRQTQQCKRCKNISACQN